MARNGAKAKRSVAAKALALLADIEGLPIEDLERQVRLATGLAKAGQAIADLNTRETMMDGHDERLDAAGEQQLRADLLRRLDDLAAELEAKACAGGDGSGPAEAAAR